MNSKQCFMLWSYLCRTVARDITVRFVFSCVIVFLHFLWRLNECKDRHISPWRGGVCDAAAGEIDAPAQHLQSRLGTVKGCAVVIGCCCCELQPRCLRVQQPLIKMQQSMQTSLGLSWFYHNHRYLLLSARTGGRENPLRSAHLVLPSGEQPCRCRAAEYSPKHVRRLSSLKQIKLSVLAHWVLSKLSSSC